MKPANSVDSNQRLLDRLMAEGRITPSLHAQALALIAVRGGRVEDLLIDHRLMTEAELLSYVATQSKTRFVSTERLYRTQIDPKLAQVIPRKLAELHGIAPVLFDEKTRTLSVVTADPDDLFALNEAKVASGMRDVVPLVVRPSAVRAFISRVYHGDSGQFALLLRSEGAPVVQHFYPGVVPPAPSAPTPSPTPPAAAPEAPPPRGSDAGAAEPPVRRPVTSDPGGNPALRASVKASDRDARTRQEPSTRSMAPPVPEEFPQFAVPPVTLTTDYVETLNVVISVLENSRPDLRGHSAQCARILKKMCDRMGLPAMQTASYVVAAYLHDLGKSGSYHLTALNVAEYEGHRAAAVRLASLPERLFQVVALQPDTRHSVASMYERYDGGGFPAGLSGKEIPLGARLLALVDSYADLTSNPRNPARAVLKPADAIQFLSPYRGTVFDPSIVDLLRADVAGEDLRAKLFAERNHLLLIDADPEESTVFELRLLEAGFSVRTARTFDQARHMLMSGEIGVVVSDVDLDSKDAGLRLRELATTESWGASVLVWVIHTARTDRHLAEKVFELGADDLVSKPTPPDVFVAKLRQLVDRKKAHARAVPRGVSGSLAEMSLPEVVQILWHGRRTGTVRLSTPLGPGEVGLMEGQIVDARVENLRGAPAFFRLLTVQSGDFHVDPEKVPTERTIHESPESLLLEGMRRLDEGDA